MPTDLSQLFNWTSFRQFCFRPFSCNTCYDAFLWQAWKIWSEKRKLVQDKGQAMLWKELRRPSLNHIVFEHRAKTLCILSSASCERPGNSSTPSLWRNLWWKSKVLHGQHSQCRLGYWTSTRKVGNRCCHLREEARGLSASTKKLLVRQSDIWD